MIGMRMATMDETNLVKVALVLIAVSSAMLAATLVIKYILGE